MKQANGMDEPGKPEFSDVARRGFWGHNTKGRRSRPPPERLRSFDTNRTRRGPYAVPGRTSALSRKSGELVLHSTSASCQFRTTRPGFHASVRQEFTPAPALPHIRPFFAPSRQPLAHERLPAATSIPHIASGAANSKCRFYAKALFFPVAPVASNNPYERQRGQMGHSSDA